MDQEIEIPQYFICPISLEIMKDPVTAITGITYDRESIEHWLFKGKNNSTLICPVTKQPLPRDSDLTPNHTLRRLIQAWCTENSSHGIDRIPTPKAPLNKFHITKLINKDLWNPNLQIKTLTQLEVFAAQNERNRMYMAEFDVPRAMITYIVTCCNKNQVTGLEEALSILNFFKIPSEILKLTPLENDKLIESFLWVLCCNEIENHKEIKSHALIVLKNIFEAASLNFFERLKPELFMKTIDVLRRRAVTQQGINAALRVMLEACPLGRNRVMMVQYGAVFELIELELTVPEKKTTELVLGILYNLCCCADGRAQFLSHRAAIAVVTRRIMQVSPAADDRAILILSVICKFSGNFHNLVVQEMLRVGTVLKLCSFLQVDSAAYLKNKAREIIRSHYDQWKDSPCIDASVLARLTR